MFLPHKNFVIFLFFSSILLPICSAYTQTKFERTRFVYTNAPENLILQAREVGANERLSFLEAVESAADDDEKMAMYAEHLGHCSILGSHITTDLVHPDVQLPTTYSFTEKIFAAIGLDRVSSNFFTMPMEQMTEMVQNACLKNELQFQCAYGFLEDLDKIHSYIEDLKKNDGNVKIMFEKECRRQTPDSSAYMCIGKTVEDWGSTCEKLINVYNITRTTVNEKSHFEYNEAVEIIETNIAMALEGKADPQAVAKESEALLKTTLNSIAHMEALKCRMYSPMERCILKRIHKVCGPDSVFNLQTILRTGYLQRERGVELHEQFSDSEIDTNKACEKLSK